MSDYQKGRGVDSKGKRDDFLFNWRWDSSEIRTAAAAGDFLLQATISPGSKYAAGIYSGRGKCVSEKEGYKTRVEAQQGAESLFGELIDKHSRLLLNLRGNKTDRDLARTLASGRTR